MIVLVESNFVIEFAQRQPEIVDAERPTSLLFAQTRGCVTASAGG